MRGADNGPASGKLGARWIVAGLLLYAALVLVRMPDIWLHPRFWAEEGTVFFESAWTQPPLTALTTPWGGYLNLIANAAALLARWTVPLEWAPVVTIGVALACQLVPPLLWLTARDGWISPAVRVAGLALLLFVPSSDEVWLQTLHCQFELSVASGLVLALAPRSGWVGVLRVGSVALAGLSGLGACALLPLFLLRFVLDRTWSRGAEAGCLALGAALQFGIFYSHTAVRGYLSDPAALLDIVFLRHLVVPFAGVDIGARIGHDLLDPAAHGVVPYYVLAWLALATACILLTLRARVRPAPNLWLLAAASALALAGYYGAIGGASWLLSPWVSDRYVFAPQSLLGIALLSAAASLPRAPAFVAWGVCLWLACLGAWTCCLPWDFLAHGPSWQREVGLWRQDPTHPLRLWPENWTVRLKPDHSPAPQG